MSDGVGAGALKILYARAIEHGIMPDLSAKFERVGAGMLSGGRVPGRLSDMKLLTIVTINRNDSAGLLRTIKSVMPLVSDRVEYLIIDGASTDDSVAQALALIGSVSGARLVSEADTGIYNAMNKGWALAEGEYVAFVNSGDELLVPAYEQYLNFLLDRRADIYYSRTYVCPVGADTPFVHERHPEQFGHDTIPHLTTAVRRALLLRLGGFDERYRVVADREFFIRASKSGASFLFYDGVVANFYMGGASSGWLTKREDALLNVRYGFISRASYFRKSCRYWLKQKLSSRSL